VSLVDEHPLVQAVDAKLTDLEMRRTEFEARVKVLAEQDVAAQAIYDKALDDALSRGGPMPPPLVRRLPELADVEVRHRFMPEEAQLREERRQAVAAAYPEVLGQARRQAKKLTAAAHGPLEKLLATMTEIGALLAAVKTCRDARNDPNQHQHYNDSPLTVEEFTSPATCTDRTNSDVRSGDLRISGAFSHRRRPPRATREGVRASQRLSAFFPIGEYLPLGLIAKVLRRGRAILNGGPDAARRHPSVACVGS
jgi:hypothetical protein